MAGPEGDEGFAGTRRCELESQAHGNIVLASASIRQISYDEDDPIPYV